MGLPTLAPRTIDEAVRFSELMAHSALIPRSYQGRPGDVFAAVQWGMELGLAPLQALQNIAVINGRPSVWGDAALALVQQHPLYRGHTEWREGDIRDGTMVAYCVVRRAIQGPSEQIIEYRGEFSCTNAKLARLWGKDGPWTNYPQRMLQMRARALALRDGFADALRGLYTAEEAQDMPAPKENEKPRDITPEEQQEAEPAPSVVEATQSAARVLSEGQREIVRATAEARGVTDEQIVAKWGPFEEIAGSDMNLLMEWIVEEGNHA